MFCVAKPSEVICLFCLSYFRSFFSFPLVFPPSLCLSPLYIVLFLPYPTLFVFNLTSLWYKTVPTYFSLHLSSSNLSSVVVFFCFVFFCTFYFQLPFAVPFIFNPFLLFCLHCFSTLLFFFPVHGESSSFLPVNLLSLFALLLSCTTYPPLPFLLLNSLVCTCDPEGSRFLFFGLLSTQRKTLSICQQVLNQYPFWLLLS